MAEPMIEHVPGAPNLLLGAYDVATLGYSMAEYFVSGTATSMGPSPTTAEYTTRLVVLVPGEGFSGTVIVEWLNVSGGIDAPAVWFMAHREFARERHAYVAVSVQRVGIEGGLSLGADMSLKSQNAARYGRLTHPGDEYAYDVFSQAGQLVRDRASDLLPGLALERLVAVGESQSALFLTTYVNVVDPSARVYDGFLVHSRFGPAAPLDGSSIFEAAEAREPAPFLDDLRVPVLTLITETDLIGGAASAGYHAARQPDTDRLRVWEVAGAAHADNYTITVGFIDSGSASVAELAAGYAPTSTLMGEQLPHCINFGPQHHYVLQAAVHHLVEWVRTGAPPPTGPLLELTDDDPPAFVVDELGLATGGIRTPWVDVPVARTSGIGSAEPLLAMVFGSGEPFDAATVARLYPGGLTEYLAAFTRSLDATIAAGHLLAADRQEILDLAAALAPFTPK